MNIRRRCPRLSPTPGNGVFRRGRPERDTHVADVIFGVTGMQTEEMPVETFAKPPTDLRHHHEMLNLTVSLPVKRPEIVSAAYIERRPRTQPEFESQIGSGRCQ